MSEAPRSICLNVKPISAEVCAELKVRAAMARVPLYIYVGRILTEHLAQVPAQPIIGVVDASARGHVGDGFDRLFSIFWSNPGDNSGDKTLALTRRRPPVSGGGPWVGASGDDNFARCLSADDGQPAEVSRCPKHQPPPTVGAVRPRRRFGNKDNSILAHDPTPLPINLLTMPQPATSAPPREGRCDDDLVGDR